MRTTSNIWNSLSVANLPVSQSSFFKQFCFVVECFSFHQMTADKVADEGGHVNIAQFLREADTSDVSSTAGIRLVPNHHFQALEKNPCRCLCLYKTCKYEWSTGLCCKMLLLQFHTIVFLTEYQPLNLGLECLWLMRIYGKHINTLQPVGTAVL